MNTLNNKYSNTAVCDNIIRVPLKVIYQTDPIIKKTWTNNSHNISQIFLKLTLNAQTNHFLTTKTENKTPIDKQHEPHKKSRGNAGAREGINSSCS
jgi:hypothetical protein